MNHDIRSDRIDRGRTPLQRPARTPVRPSVRTPRSRQTAPASAPLDLQLIIVPVDEPSPAYLALMRRLLTPRPEDRQVA
jgi:hypothetical protein